MSQRKARGSKGKLFRPFGDEAGHGQTIGRGDVVHLLCGDAVSF